MIYQNWNYSNVGGKVLQLGIDLIRSLACGTASGSRSNYTCTINLGQTGRLGECQLRRKHIVKQALEYVHNVPPKPIYLVEVHDNLMQTISNILCWICLFTAVGLLRQPLLLFNLKLSVVWLSYLSRTREPPRPAADASGSGPGLVAVWYTQTVTVLNTLHQHSGNTN